MGGLGRGAAAARADSGGAEADAGRLRRGPIRAATGQGRTAARRRESAARRGGVARALPAESGGAAAGGSRGGGHEEEEAVGDISLARPNIDQSEGPFSFAYQPSLLQVE
jgi:hypothetical protein